MSDMNSPEYRALAELTFKLVEAAKIQFSELPLFAMGPRGVALGGSLADWGDKLVRNNAARALLRTLLEESERLKIGDYPTIIMLAAALETYGIPVLHRPLEELGFKGDLIPVARGGQS